MTAACRIRVGDIDGVQTLFAVSDDGGAQSASRCSCAWRATDSWYCISASQPRTAATAEIEYPGAAQADA